MECCLISLKMVTFPSPKPFPKTLTQQLDVFWVHNNGESVGPLSRKFWPFYGLVSKWTWGLNKPLVYGHYKRGNDSLDLGVWGSNFIGSPQEIITNLHNIIYIYLFHIFCGIPWVHPSSSSQDAPSPDGDGASDGASSPEPTVRLDSRTCLWNPQRWMQRIIVDTLW
jgi:hypothetical protein